MLLKKPQKLKKGDIISTISPCWGISGESNSVWKYKIGKKRLEEMGLTVIPAPNSQKGEWYLKNNPQARAEDILWAFENKEVKAIIANIGGNDSDKVLPFLDSNTIQKNPKIFIGYSDVMNYHLYCYKAGLSTFYGHNLLTTLAETPNFHPYSKKWFKKVLFNDHVVGEIEPSEEYSLDRDDFSNQNFIKHYEKNNGYLWLQGKGKVTGSLFGGHTGLREYGGLLPEDFEGTILFLEDIAEFFTPVHLSNFFDWLGRIGALQRIKGLLIGRLCERISFSQHEKMLLKVINEKYGLVNLPIVANMNFGHTSPICILPYGAKTQIDCIHHKVSILESGTI